MSKIESFSYKNYTVLMNNDKDYITIIHKEPTMQWNIKKDEIDDLTPEGIMSHIFSHQWKCLRG